MKRKDYVAAWAALIIVILVFTISILYPVIENNIAVTAIFAASLLTSILMIKG